MTATNQEIIDLLGKDTLLWSPSLDKHVAPSEILASKVVCGNERTHTSILLFLSHSISFHSLLGLVLFLGTLVWTYVKTTE